MVTKRVFLEKTEVFLGRSQNESVTKNLLSTLCCWEAAVHTLDKSWKKMDVKKIMMILLIASISHAIRSTKYVFRKRVLLLIQFLTNFPEIGDIAELNLILNRLWGLTIQSLIVTDCFVCRRRSCQGLAELLFIQYFSRTGDVLVGSLRYDTNCERFAEYSSFNAITSATRKAKWCFINLIEMHAVYDYRMWTLLSMNLNLIPFDVNYARWCAWSHYLLINWHMAH